MWRNILLVPLAMLVALLVFEALARLWIDIPNPYALKPGVRVLDQRGFWVPQPGFEGVMDNRADFRDKRVRIDDDGTRHVPCRAKADAPQSGQASGGRQRIFLLGDSQTFGFGLSDGETWPNRLQCGLGTKAHVFNMGVHGTNIDQYVKRGLRQVMGALRRNDIVVAGVTWNDLISPQPARNVAQARDDAAGIPGDNGGLTASLLKPVKHLTQETWRSRFYRKTGILVPVFGSWGTFAESLTYSSALARIAVPRARLLYYRFRPSDTFAGKLRPGDVQRNMELLGILNRAVERAGGHLIVYMLPNRLFFDDTYYAAYSAAGTAFPAQDYMTNLAAPYCARDGLRCVTAFDGLKTPGPDTYTYVFDGHYNESGAAVIAGVLRRYLERECVAGGRRCLLVDR